MRTDGVPCGVLGDGRYSALFPVLGGLKSLTVFGEAVSALGELSSYARLCYARSTARPLSVAGVI
jgi:hypothetical protein